MYLLAVVYSIFFVLTVIFAKWLWSRRHLYRLSWEMPGPVGWPFVGCGLPLLRKSKGYPDNIELLVQMAETYGAVIKVWLGTEMYVLLSRPEDIGTVMMSPKCPNRMNDKKHMKTLMGGDGLFSIEGPYAKRHRRLIAPFFNLNSVQNYVPHWNKNALVAVKQLEDVTDMNVDIRPLLFTGVVRAFVETLLTGNPDLSYVQQIQEYIAEGEKILGALIYGPWYQINFIWNLSSYKKTMDRLKGRWIELAINTVENRKSQEFADMTLIEKLIRETEENSEFTQENIRLEVSTIMASAESTITTLTFAILLLAMHPEWQETIFQEISTILLNKEELTMSHLDKMINLNMCLKEAMRLFPGTPIYGRRVDETIKIGKYTIPPGIGIVVNAFQVNRNPEYWGPDSNEYKPKRFHPENLKHILPNSYLTFGVGYRNCFGMLYAETLIQTFLVQIIREYKISTTLKYENLKVFSLMVMHLDGKSLVQLHPRNI